MTTSYGAALSGGVKNNILDSNAGWGINFTTAPATVASLVDYNAFRSNSLGTITLTKSGPHDVTLTANPFVAVGSNDFSLNNTAGGGAACRFAGFPGPFAGGNSTGYLDIGAVQARWPMVPIGIQGVM